MESCKNCGERILKRYSFCPNCSQKTAIHKLSVHDVAHDAIHYFTHADRGLFTLVRDLTLKTGIVAHEYINGMRKKHFPPLNFYLIVGFILLIAYNLQYLPPELTAMAQQSVDENTTDIRALYQIREAKMRLFMIKHSDMLMILALPVTAFSFWLLYIRGKYNFIEHLVACMYMAGYFMLVYAVLIIPAAYIFNWPDDVGTLAHFGFQIVYSVIFYHRFMQKKTWRGAVRPLLAVLLGGTLWITFTMLINLLYIRTGFWGLFA